MEEQTVEAVQAAETTAALSAEEAAQMAAFAEVLDEQKPAPAQGPREIDFLLDIPLGRCWSTRS
ncbi:MAG: hypothetical protein H6Q84_1994 [Deltaproteobacteria bacterium]|nr:hypothetical protein [Deltaproteobacteria bacterium]